MRSIKLHHFGEDLVAGLINKLGHEKFLDFLTGPSSFCPVRVSAEALSEKLKRISYLRTLTAKIPACESMVSLEFTHPEWTADSEHKIDVCLGSSQGSSFPIEVKMGTTGSMQSWSNFQSYMIKNPMRLRDPSTTDSTPYIDGAMSSFLADLRDETLPFKTIVRPGFEYWGLCIRRAVRNKFELTQVKDNRVENVPLIFIFEDLLEYYDTHSGTPHGEIIDQIFEDSKNCIKSEILKL